MKHNKGINAERPRNIPFKGWKDVLLRVKDQMEKDNLPIMAAGVAFYFFMALFPALLAAVSLYALVTDPQQLQEHMNYAGNVLPAEAHDILTDRLESIIETQDSGLGWGLAISLLFSIWSANKGTFFLFRALNVVYDEKSTRGMIKQNAITLSFTIGFMIVGILSMTIVIAFPALIGVLGLPDILETVLRYARWLVMAVIVMFCFAMIYQFAPQRQHPKLRWVSPGSIIATVLWILGSLAFSLYVQNFDNFEEMYGSVAAVIILMLWLNLTAFIILMGAEINAELEHQTKKDTTMGDDSPRGERNAHYADHVAAEDYERNQK